jgi:putative heme-binding domain-containing protein
VSIYPQHDTFGIERAMLVAPGEPDRSILYHRVNRRGPGQMPPLVTKVVDARAAELIRQWIESVEPQRPFVKEWTLEELAPALGEVAGGRSFASGQAAFRDAGCVQCHRFCEEGGGAGPDLTGVASRLKPDEMLEAVVTPSKKIAEGYAATVVLTTDGVLLQGPLASETDEAIVLRAGTSFSEPITVRKSEIEERSLSDRSIMPDGTINCLERHQVMDLLAYLVANGEAGHGAFGE